jgi:ligand-binding sensor domain-containing protein
VWGYDKLLRYDSRADSWTTFTADDHPLLAQKFNAFYVAADGTLWVAGKGGLAHYDGSEWTTETLEDDADAVSGTPDGDVWAASGGDLYHRTADGWERYDWASSWVRGVQGAADGTVWAWGDDLGHFNPVDGTWQTFTAADGLVPGDISSVWITPEGVVWVGTNRGVSRYVP